MSWTLPVLFFITAILYAAVGFGGGSTYSALLVLSGTNYLILPAIALACNIVVVSGGVLRFSRAGHLSIQRLAPFVAASIPAAWVGGRMPISETMFIGLLGGALLISGLHLLFALRPSKSTPNATPQTHWLISLSFGGGIGLLSGVVGIGGGIFLAPILYHLRWGSAKQIAGACSLFILLNSLSGLAGQLTKLADLSLLEMAQPYWVLLVAVFIGGQIGSWLGAGKLSPKWMRLMTGLLILYVAVRLLLRWSGSL